MTLQAGLVAAAVGMNRVESGANPQWVEAMTLAVETVARKQLLFNADDVFKEAPLGIETKDNRAFGPVMVRAKRAGLCEPTPVFVKSEREDLHATDIRVWRSRVYVANDNPGRQSQSDGQSHTCPSCGYQW